MPAYDYRCPVCHYMQTELHEPEERKRVYCPRCEERLQWVFPVPQILTDSFKGLEDGFGNDWRSRKRAHAIARRAGVNPTGKRFIPSMCRKGVPFDPMAWVDSKGDVRRRCLREGWGLNADDGGIGSVQPREQDTTATPYEVAPDIVERETEKIAATEYNGDVTPKEKRDLKEKMRQRLRGTQD